MITRSFSFFGKSGADDIDTVMQAAYGAYKEQYGWMYNNESEIEQAFDQEVKDWIKGMQ